MYGLHDDEPDEQRRWEEERRQQKHDNEIRLKARVGRYTVAEIKRYLEGRRVCCPDGSPSTERNKGLDSAIKRLGDKRFGINAKLKRDKSKKK